MYPLLFSHVVLLATQDYLKSIYLTDFWRTVMSQDHFVVTPTNYTRQLEVDFRGKSGTVTFNELEEARHRCTKWINANKDHLSSPAKM